MEEAKRKAQDEECQRVMLPACRLVFVHIFARMRWKASVSLRPQHPLHRNFDGKVMWCVGVFHFGYVNRVL